jgi:hypothetical protein
MEYSLMAYTRNPNSIRAGVALQQTPAPSPLAPAGILPVLIDAKVATTSDLGVVKIGDNISISPDGTISVAEPSDFCNYNTILVSQSYNASDTDYYIGVNSNQATTVTLPINPSNGKQIIIKAEMTPPVGSRKITIKTGDNTLIDGAVTQVLQQSYQVINLIFRDNWYII